MSRTSNINEFIEEDEVKLNFDGMMNEVLEEIKEYDSEDAVISHAFKLRQFMKKSPSKLQVSVKVADAGRKTI